MKKVDLKERLIADWEDKKRQVESDKVHMELSMGKRVCDCATIYCIVVYKNRVLGQVAFSSILHERCFVRLELHLHRAFLIKSIFKSGIVVAPQLLH